MLVSVYISALICVYISTLIIFSQEHMMWITAGGIEKEYFYKYQVSDLYFAIFCCFPAGEQHEIFEP